MCSDKWEVLYNKDRNYNGMQWRQFVLRQGAMMNCSNKIQTKANKGDQTREEDLQLGELEVLEELPWQSCERILWQVSAEGRKTKRKLNWITLYELFYVSFLMSRLLCFCTISSLFFSYILMSFGFRNPISKSFCESFWHFSCFLRLNKIFSLFGFPCPNPTSLCAYIYSTAVCICK